MLSNLYILGVVQTRKCTIILPKNAVATSDMLHFFNDLVDSFNGKKEQGLSSTISINSGHIQFWEETCKKLSKMQYVDKET